MAFIPGVKITPRPPPPFLGFAPGVISWFNTLTPGASELTVLIIPKYYIKISLFGLNKRLTE